MQNKSLLDLYRFGYAVQENGQFHHETIGSDNITYGCYGYLDPIGQLFITYYLSDGWGYRVVQPGEDVELFYHEHEEAPEGVDPGEYYKEHHGDIVSWNTLQFPDACEQAGSGLVSVITRPNPPRRKSKKFKHFFLFYFFFLMINFFVHAMIS